MRHQTLMQFFKMMKRLVYFYSRHFFLLLDSLHFFSPLSCVFSLFRGWLLSLHLFVLCCCHPYPNSQLVQWIVNILVLLILPVTSYLLRDHTEPKKVLKVAQRCITGDLFGFLMSKWRQITTNGSKVSTNKKHSITGYTCSALRFTHDKTGISPLR